jgi:predicted aconitase
MELTAEERDWLAGGRGPAVAMSLRIVADMGRILGADRLIPVASAHIDGCLYHGPAGLNFAERLVEGGGRVAVPSTLNVSALDLRRPERVRLNPAEQALVRRLMQAYETLGCTPTWTCAPYQAGHRPALGQDVAWAESNAVVFANSVLGARTNRYGDFMDIACALTGRAPRYGLHVEENRRATLLIDTGAIAAGLKEDDSFFPVLGSWLGRAVGDEIAVIEGLPETTTEDQLKALGAAAASTGAVALVHVAGVTPEAPTVAAALHDKAPRAIRRLDPAELRATRDLLSTARGDALDAVALGSPHMSEAEFRTLERLLEGRKVSVPVYVCTGRGVFAGLSATGRAAALESLGIQIIVDTCVVVTPILKGNVGDVLMTNSGKFAHYGPSNTGYHTIFGSLADCVESAVAGRVIRDERLWA